jgi:hypothetical protein
MPADGRPAHVESFRKLARPPRPLAQQLHDATSSGIGQSRQRNINIINHTDNV